MTNHRSRIAGVLLALLVGFLGFGSAAEAATAPTSPASSTQVSPRQNSCGDLAGFEHAALSSLPAEATDTYQLILKGGPFPYPKNDGVVFDNREGILPSCDSGYYHEYTVPTPGSSDRGTRRIVTGEGGEYFYTGDHYESFQVIDIDGGGGDTTQCGDLSKLDTAGYSTLSAEAKKVVDGVRAGSATDGKTYENREGILPSCDAGYYTLYPVGSEDRVISGEGGELAYTPDDYATFQQIDLDA
ncbi:ribonuclease domain-containing protein [Amycolatopsis jiangsuensis]|uniref:Guanyl-specific ribonuclease Sa n=1 Tax=Amycolatopsis jiangsuensis TaxID=1181879 RepID=A0A840IVI8_9PSEU|nr:ribonuclease domain-containing protein [Amycolatopsis jiangsuensis]MBB4685445.1 guanyl-specific ribonuclease Sa [Amycolatopsis jiangsuensis]